MMFPPYQMLRFIAIQKKCIFRNMSIHIMANTIMKLTNLLMIWKKLY